MSFAQPEVIDSCAYWIGAHALAFLLVIFLTALGVIAALWHCSKLADWNFGLIQTAGADASLSGLSRGGFGNVTHVCGVFLTCGSRLTAISGCISPSV
jgi:hypothetical protein